MLSWEQSEPPLSRTPCRRRLPCPPARLLDWSFLGKPLALYALCLLTCLSFGPPAHAQNSGGGWVAHLNGNPGPFPYGVTPWDWTGLTVNSTSVSSNGTSSSGTSTAYTSFNHSGIILGGTADRSDSVTISGAATYVWFWTPTGSNVSAPAPPLYVLARASGGATLAPNGPGNGAGLSGSATFNYSSSVPAYFYGSESVVTQYKALPASGSPNAFVAVSPSLTAKILGAPTGSNGVGVIELSTAAFPIVLSSPNPMGRPDLGDGTNQYVYDNGLPGKVNVPSVISVPGAGTPDTSWLAAGNHVDMTFAPAIAGQQPHTWSGFQNYVGSGSYFTFVGLPTSSAGSVSDPNSFGNHLAILKVDGNNSQSAHFQTFFDMKASNWPSTNNYDPNWFHYYQQLYTPPQADIEPVYYNANLPARGITTIGFLTGSTNPSSFTYNVQVGPNAVDADIVNVFDVDPTTKLVKRIGGLSITGIHSFVRVMSHEEEHVHLVKQQIVVPYNSQTGPPYGVTDSDSDGIPDDWEKAHHLKPDNADTTGEYQNTTGNNAGKGDVECLCDIFAMGELSSHQSLWQQDWGAVNNGGSYSGLQYGKRPLYFPWQYIDDATSSISTSLPNNALTALP